MYERKITTVPSIEYKNIDFAFSMAFWFPCENIITKPVRISIITASVPAILVISSITSVMNLIVGNVCVPSSFGLK